MEWIGNRLLTCQLKPPTLADEFGWKGTLNLFRRGTGPFISSQPEFGPAVGLDDDAVGNEARHDVRRLGREGDGEKLVLPGRYGVKVEPARRIGPRSQY